MKRVEKKVTVWDPFVRFFHWSLVLLVGTSFLSGEDLLGLHALAGYLVLALLLFRIVWGLIGTKPARFSDFVFSPRTVFGYLRDLATLKAKRYLGHGPAGGAMAVALIATLLATALTGFAVYGGQEAAGPLAVFMPTLGSWIGVVKELHEFLAGMIVFLVSLHLLGVLFSSWAHQENLIKGMWTGEKRAEEPLQTEGGYGVVLEEEAVMRRRAG